MHLRFFILLLCTLAASSLQAGTFAEFMTSHSLTGSDALADADPDGDRIPNLMEYALDGMDPTELDAASPSMPTFCFARRIGTELGEWEYAGTSPPSDGVGGVWHAAILFRPRPASVGIRYNPQISDVATLERWFDGCSAVRSEMMHDGTVMSVSLTQGQRYKRFFMRLEVVEDPGLVDALAGFAINGNSGLALITGTPMAEPRVISGGSTSSVTVQDMNFVRTTGATTVTDWRWTYSASPFNLAPTTVTRSADPALLSVSGADPFVWTWVGNGATQLNLATATSTYRTNVTNLTATGQTVDVWASNASGSLRAHAESSIDTRIAGETASTSMPLWTTRTPGTSTYVRNTSCWGSDIDLTPFAAYNSAAASGFENWAGLTLITPRHVIGAEHTNNPFLGSTVHFVTASNVVCSRTITAVQRVGTTDIRIGLLNADVDAGIAFARVLPANWESKLPSLGSRRVAVARITQLQKLGVHDLYDLDDDANFMPPTGDRAAFHAAAVYGDSGSPLFLVVNDDMVLLGTLWSIAEAPSVTYHRTAINAAITALGGGYTAVTDADLSSFTTF
jgi:hypothetical protein